MKKRVHRPLTKHEKAAFPAAFTFNRASDTYHDLYGYQVGKLERRPKGAHDAKQKT